MNNVMRSCFLSIWNIIDPIYYFFTRLTYVQCENNRNSIFRVRITRYRGGDFILSDGTIIKTNDKLIKIHLHNAKLLRDLNKLKCEVRRGRYIFHNVMESLPGLAEYIEDHPRKDELKGIIGITSLHRGCNRLGFETCEIKSRVYRLLKKASFILIFFIASSTFSKKTYKKQEPKYLFMSINTLTNRYLSKVNQQ